MRRKKLPTIPDGFERQIIKVQKPLAYNGPAMALIYNEDRSITAELPFDDQLAEVFGNDLKQYWLADLPVKTSGYIKMLKQMPEQDW